jgi:hypothetical protein
VAVLLWCTMGLGRGGVASASPCRAGACEERGQTGSWRTGTRRMLLARWAARSAHVDVDGATCTVTLEWFCFRESIRWVEAGLAAR